MTARRQQRTLTQKVRYVSAEDQVAETPVVETSPVAPEETASETSHEVSADSRDNNANIPRRSRRSPRHLRVSGQRRRRYRDERYPQQSPMPLETAAASPEMASGKVWIRYDLPAVQAETETPHTATEVAEVAPQTETRAPAVTATPAEPQALPEQAADVAETNAVVAEKHDVDTVTPVSEAEVIDVTAVAEETPAVSQTDTEVASAPVAEHGVAETIAPVEAPQTEQAAVPPAEAEEPSPVQTNVPAPQAAMTEASVETAEPVKAAAPVETAEPVKAAAPVKTAAPSDSSATARYRYHATAPMTKAPAPEWQPEPLPHSDWVRPQYAFTGKGSAGGHAATHHATAPVTKTGE